MKKVPSHIKRSVREQAIRGKVRQPDLANLVNFFFDAAGGERMVARMLYQEFLDAPSGGIVRSRIIDLIIRAMTKTQESTIPDMDLGMLTDKDLEAELDGLLGEISDAQQDQPDPRPAGEQENHSQGRGAQENPGTARPDPVAAGESLAAELSRGAAQGHLGTAPSDLAEQRKRGQHWAGRSGQDAKPS